MRSIVRSTALLMSRHWFAGCPSDVLKVPIDKDHVVNDAADPRVPLFVITEVQEIQETIGHHRLDRVVQPLDCHFIKQPASIPEDA